MNSLPFVLQDCMSTETAFAGYEDNILIVTNDDSDYYVPAFDVMTLTEMCPGEAYGVFLSGASAIDFTYPTGGGFSSSHADVSLEDYRLRTRTDDVAQTGESHLRHRAYYVNGVLYYKGKILQ